MRGSRPLFLGKYVCRGIIPAHAGLTNFIFGKSSSFRDHPRACGAHVFNSPADIGGWGSSPRMRGSLESFDTDVARTGIIPAHAGLTHHSVVRDMAALGSSPRMRGSRWVISWVNVKNGIIPAHAGLTGQPGRSAGSRRDHPRACGAHLARSS